MNINYTRKQLKEAMDIIGNMEVTKLRESHKVKINRQRRLNEAYSILFDLDKLFKMEEEDDL